MSRVDKLAEEINVYDTVTKLNTLDKRSPDYKEKYSMIISEFSKKAVDKLKDESIQTRVAFLDEFYNHAPVMAVHLLNTRNEELIRAQLVLEHIKGIDIMSLKYDLKKAKGIYTAFGLASGLLSNKTNNAINCGDAICSILNKYLIDKNPRDITELVNDDTIEFYRNFKEVEDNIFTGSEEIHFPTRQQFIYELFKSNVINDEIKSKVYNEVLKTNPYLENFDYSKILEEDKSLLYSVKGIYKDCPRVLFNKLADDDTYGLKFPYFKAMYFFKEIIEANKDDEDGLKSFFIEFEKRKDKCPKLMKRLENKDFYKKYKVENLDKKYEEAVKQLLNGNKDIDRYLIQSLGESKAFVDNFDELLERFTESTDDDYKRFLIMPLTTALAKIQKEKCGLSFEIDNTSTSISTNTLGYYSREDNALFINPFHMKYALDLDAELALAFNVVNHEVVHANQYKALETTSGLDYDKLLMAMDIFLMSDIVTSFYENNYKHISFERDARACAYVETKKLLKKYPKLAEKLTPENEDEFILSDYIRKDTVFLAEYYYGVVDSFEEKCNAALSICANEQDEKIKKAMINKTKSDIFKYPVIKDFYDYDKENNQIKRKPDEYFDNKLKELESFPDSISKRKQIYSINAFRYAIKVGEYLKEEGNGFRSETNEGYSEEVIKEVTDAVGPKPSK